MQNESSHVNGTTRFRLETGVEVLEEWAENASQSKKNAVYAALFAMLDGSLFETHRVVDDFQRPNEFFVLVKDDLVVKIRINCFASFGIVAIGTCGSAADLQRGRWNGA